LFDLFLPARKSNTVNRIPTSTCARRKTRRHCRRLFSSSKDALSGIAAAKAAKMRVAAIPDTRFADPHDYGKEADYILSSLKEVPSLIRNLAAMF
jgi:hypothetical protein